MFLILLRVRDTGPVLSAFKQMEELKNKCRPRWIEKVGSIDGFEKTWKIMSDAGSYAFNASHSYCVGGDGAEIAYCKANYPFESFHILRPPYSKLSLFFIMPLLIVNKMSETGKR